MGWNTDSEITQQLWSYERDGKTYYTPSGAYAEKTGLQHSTRYYDITYD
jgi:YHS domain-containing protein